MGRRVVVASGNAGKVRELAAALGHLGWQLVAQSELGVGSVPETASTFVENALIKARHAAAASGLAAIGDDSGLVVPALGGAPGIYSARYAGDEADDARNNAKLIEALAAAEDRSAYFFCALVHLSAADDPVPTIATARWPGSILATPRGSGGFGYDPHFFVAQLGKTAAELSMAEKNRLSHRGQACRRLAALLGEQASLEEQASLGERR